VQNPTLDRAELDHSSSAASRWITPDPNVTNGSPFIAQPCRPRFIRSTQTIEKPSPAIINNPHGETGDGTTGTGGVTPLPLKSSCTLPPLLPTSRSHMDEPAVVGLKVTLSWVCSPAPRLKVGGTTANPAHGATALPFSVSPPMFVTV